MITQSDQLFAALLGTTGPLLLGLVVLNVTVLRSICVIRGDIRKLHLQQANIITMLLRAGFRPAKSCPDWRDDGDQTQAPSFTRFDWRTPDERHGR